MNEKQLVFFLYKAVQKITTEQNKRRRLICDLLIRGLLICGHLNCGHLICGHSRNLIYNTPGDRHQNIAILAILRDGKSVKWEQSYLF